MTGDFSTRYAGPNANPATGARRRQLREAEREPEPGALPAGPRLHRRRRDRRETLIDPRLGGHRARDVIGAGVAAVPTSDQPAGFHVADAITPAGGRRSPSPLLPGRVWADGLLVQPRRAAAETRVATYLGRRSRRPAVAIDHRDRRRATRWCWRCGARRSAASSVPTSLIEPALGGPDTTERMVTRLRAPSVPHGPRDNCATIATRLPTTREKGTLTVTLSPPRPRRRLSGGRGGRLHGVRAPDLYRIEIADVAAGPRCSSTRGSTAA